MLPVVDMFARAGIFKLSTGTSRVGAELEKLLVEKFRNEEAICVLEDSKIANIAINKAVTSSSQRIEGKDIEIGRESDGVGG